MSVAAIAGRRGIFMRRRRFIYRRAQREGERERERE